MANFACLMYPSMQDEIEKRLLNNTKNKIVNPLKYTQEINKTIAVPGNQIMNNIKHVRFADDMQENNSYYSHNNNNNSQSPPARVCQFEEAFDDVAFSQYPGVSWLREFRFKDWGGNKPFDRFCLFDDGFAIIEIDEGHHRGWNQRDRDIANTIQCMKNYRVHFLRVWHSDFARLSEVLDTFFGRVAMTDSGESVLMFSSADKYANFIDVFSRKTGKQRFWDNGFILRCNRSQRDLRERGGTGTDCGGVKREFIHSWM